MRRPSGPAPAVAAEPDAGETAVRVAALAAGLRSLLLPDAGTVLVVVCGDHGTDQVVAARAAQRVGLHPSFVKPDSPLLGLALTDRPALVLACAEGSAAVAQTRLPCRIFGDHPGMPWWRTLELLHRPARDRTGSTTVSAVS